MMQFIAKLRSLSGGKPAGFKLCVGHPWEFLAICKAMLETGESPGFHRRRRQGRRHRRGAAGIHRPSRHAAARRARSSCIMRWSAPDCATDQDRRQRQDRDRLRHRARHGARRGLVQQRARLHVRARLHPVPVLPYRPLSDRRRDPGPRAPTRARRADKTERVANFHRATLKALAEMVAAAGLDHPGEICPEHFCRRISPHSYASFAELYPQLETGSFLTGEIPSRYAEAWRRARPDSFLLG